ncbi:MAG: hypothetical protein IRY90_02760 [Actinomadura rubrobrunea]|nr:hypothetical protein [Actinomadura rubrobrunea]
MSTLALSDSMMSIATTEATAASVLLPPAMMISFEFKLSTGKAAELDKAGQEWRKAAEQIEQLCNDLRKSVSAIPRQDWSAEDRPRYEAKVQEFCAQLAVLQTLCMAIGIALTVLAYALLAYAVFAVAMGTFLAALAAAAAVAIATVVGAGAYAGMLTTAGTCLTITHVATGILAAAGQMGATVFAGGSALAAVVEAGRGNRQALADFLQAQATGSGAALANLGQNAANAGLAWLNRNPKVTKPLQEIDLDADRNYDRTWNIGGGAKIQTTGGGEHEFGVHTKYGDRGWQGVDGEYKYTSPTGVNVGGKAGWEEDKDGNNIFSGGINGGYEHEATGIGGSGGVEGSYNTGTGGWSGKGEVSGQWKGGDVYKEQHEYTNDGHGKGEWKHKTETAVGDSELPPWDLV